MDPDTKEWLEEELDIEMHNFTTFDKASGSRFIDEKHLKKVVGEILTKDRAHIYERLKFFADHHTITRSLLTHFDDLNI